LPALPKSRESALLVQHQNAAAKHKLNLTPVAKINLGVFMCCP
jgi:hypothetical protein